MNDPIRPAKIPSPFKVVSSEDQEIRFEAVVPLPDDGTSANLLVVQVSLDASTSKNCEVRLINRTWRDNLLGSFEMPVANLANALYGFAKIKTVAHLEIGP